MIKRMLLLTALAAVAAALAAGWPDIQRFFRIRQVSTGSAHPEKVPAKGRTVYPKTTRDSEPDGTGDFDSAMRGGPALI
ncbi:MAG TPA: hypothetical protein VLX31_01990 [Streptosporangiaceae bacterium]|nr:hypothetical protein [Streptosporangiaceae bacterium]